MAASLIVTCHWFVKGTLTWLGLCDYCSQKENLDCANDGGWTPLMYASYIGHELVVQQLLEAGVSVNSTNNKGETPLVLATSCGNDKTAELLIKVRLRTYYSL